MFIRAVHDGGIDANNDDANDDDDDDVYENIMSNV